MTLTINSGAQQSPATSLSSSLAAAITVQVLKDVDELRELSSEWQELWRQTPEASAFQASAWILACAEHGARRDTTCFAMVLRAGGEPLAIFPTQLNARGILSFIGAELSNYCGPVYVPSALPFVLAAWRDVVSGDPRIKSVDLTGLRERSLFLATLTQCAFPRWGKPVVVETNTCPEVDLQEIGENAFHTHKSRQRANWRRKWDSLKKLGRLEFVETSDPDELAAVFPRLFELYDARWRGRRVRGAFSREQYPLQLEAAKALGSQGLVRLSLLRLDDEIVAFAYAIRGRTHSTSYVLAHDPAFEVYSPGLLLLIKLLQAAAARGDTCYDFSLGKQPYKTTWATGEQRVFSVLLGRGTAVAAMKRRCWRVARSIPLLRRLKQEGLRRLSVRNRSQDLADQPGLSAGRAGMWYVYRIHRPQHPAPELLHRPLPYAEMRALFSPRLLALALDRHYRGDDALAVEHEGRVVGAIWRAAQHRHSIVTGGYLFPPAPGPIYYHPVAAEGEVIQQVALSVPSGKSVVVSSRRLRSETVSESHTFRGNQWFRPYKLPSPS